MRRNIIIIAMLAIVASPFFISCNNSGNNKSLSQTATEKAYVSEIYETSTLNGGSEVLIYTFEY